MIALLNMLAKNNNDASWWYSDTCIDKSANTFVATCNICNNIIDNGNVFKHAKQHFADSKLKLFL